MALDDLAHVEAVGIIRAFVRDPYGSERVSTMNTAEVWLREHHPTPETYIAALTAAQNKEAQMGGGQLPSIGRIVTYRSRTGDYDVPAIINATTETLNPKGVEAGHVPALSSETHVHLTVFTPGKPGMRRGAEDFKTLPEGGHEALSENVAGCYQEWDIPFYSEPQPGAWRWPVIR